MPSPSGDPGEDDEPLTFAMLRRLCEHVLCEGYGEPERARPEP